MEDNPQRQLLIVAMLFWIIPIVVLVISSILTLGLFGYYHSKIAIIFAAIIGILLIKFSIKKITRIKIFKIFSVRIKTFVITA